MEGVEGGGREGIILGFRLDEHSSWIHSVVSVELNWEKICSFFSSDAANKLIIIT